MKKRLFICMSLDPRSTITDKHFAAVNTQRSSKISLRNNSLIVLHLAFFSFFDHRKSAGALRGGA
jgi:hypothetical protein